MPNRSTCSLLTSPLRKPFPFILFIILDRRFLLLLYSLLLSPWYWPLLFNSLLTRNPLRTLFSRVATASAKAGSLTPSLVPNLCLHFNNIGIMHLAYFLSILNIGISMPNLKVDISNTYIKIFIYEFFSLQLVSLYI